MALLNREQLTKKIEELGLKSIYSGTYLKNRVAKDFSAEDKKTREIAVKMAERAVEHSMEIGLKQIEEQAKKQGYSVRYNFDERTNSVEVVMIEGQQLSTVETMDQKALSDFMVDVPKFNVVIGTESKTLHNRMSSTKMLNPHIGKNGQGNYFTTQAEDILAAVAEQIQKMGKEYKTRNAKKYGLMKAIREGKDYGSKGVVANTSHAFADWEKAREEQEYADSHAREAMLRTTMRIGGIIGEISAKVDFTKKMRQAKNLTEKQEERYRRDADALISKYVVIAQTAGNETADAYFKQAKELEKLGITSEAEIEEYLKSMVEAMGDFRSLRANLAFSSENALNTKTLVYGGGKDIPFYDPFSYTGRHWSQTKNFLTKRSDRKLKKGIVNKRQVVPLSMSDKEDMAYFDSSEQELYQKALVSREEAIKDAYEKAREAVLQQEKKKRIENYKKKHKNKISKKKREEIGKSVESEFAKKAPMLAPSISEDMGLMSEAGAKAIASQRIITHRITRKEYEELRKEAEGKFAALDPKKRNALGEDDESALEEYAKRYIAKRVTGESKLSNVDLFQDDTGMFSVYGVKKMDAKQAAKTLDMGENLRETKQVIWQSIWDEMTKILGVSGAQFISKTPKIKTEEIGNWAQIALDTWALNNQSKQKRQSLKKKYAQYKDQNGNDFLSFKDGRIVINNSSDFLHNPDMKKVIAQMLVDLGLMDWGKDDDGNLTGDLVFNTNNSGASLIYDAINMADVWTSKKGVQTGYKESTSTMRDIESYLLASSVGVHTTPGTRSENAKKFEAMKQDVDKIYNPTIGKNGQDAIKARDDINAIMAQDTGSIFRTFASYNKNREKAVTSLKKNSYHSGDKISKRKKKYIISVGNGSGYTIDVNNISNNIDSYLENGGHLSEEQLRGTFLGAIDAVRQQLISAGVPAENIDLVVDPGTDFGFTLQDDNGNEKGYVGNFVVLPNVDIDSFETSSGEKMFDLPGYSKSVNELMYSMKRGFGSDDSAEKAHGLIHDIFKYGNSTKSPLYERGYKKRASNSIQSKIYGFSQEELSGKSEEEIKRLSSAMFGGPALIRRLLSDRAGFTDKNGIYDMAEHANVLNQYYKYLTGSKEDSYLLDDAQYHQEDLDKLIETVIKSMIGNKKGLIGLSNRFPSISRHATAFTELFLDESMMGSMEIKVGPGLAKFLNGDFDGDTVNFILGLWSNGMSLEGAIEMVERQKEINRRIFAKMEKMPSSGKKSGIPAEELKKFYSPEQTTLSALATKFNKPYTGLFSNMSTRIRDALKAQGYDYDKIDPNVSDEDQIVKYIQGELVASIGQVLEQDSISSKKVDQRIQAAWKKKREEGKGALTQEEISKIEQDTLTEFEKLDELIRNPGSSFKEIIDRMSSMELFGDDMISQISLTSMSQIEYILDQLSGKSKDASGLDARARVLSKVGMNPEQLSKGAFDIQAILKAADTIESTTGRKIFFGEYGSGFAGSREYTPGMKSDIFQLEKLIKGFQKLGTVAKQVGAALDESGRKFNDMGEKIGDAQGILHNEAEEEKAKIAIATKEAAAMNSLASSVNQYGEALNTLPKYVRQTTLSHANQPLFDDVVTDTYDPRITNKVAEYLHSGFNVKGKSFKEIASLYGYEEGTEDDLEKFKGRREKSVARDIGTFVHELNEVAEIAYKKGILTFNADSDDIEFGQLLRLSDEGLRNRATKAIDGIKNILSLVGITEPGEVNKYMRGAAGRVNKEAGSLFDYIGANNGGILSIEQALMRERGVNGQMVSGHADVMGYTMGSDDNKHGFIWDWKNPYQLGQLDFGYVSQIIGYLASAQAIQNDYTSMLANMKKENPGMRKEDMESNARKAVLDKYNASFADMAQWLGLENPESITDEWLKEFLDIKTWDQGKIRYVDASGKDRDVDVDISRFKYTGAYRRLLAGDVEGRQEEDKILEMLGISRYDEETQKKLENQKLLNSYLEKEYSIRYKIAELERKLDLSKEAGLETEEIQKEIEKQKSYLETVSKRAKEEFGEDLYEETKSSEYYKKKEDAFNRNQRLKKDLSDTTKEDDIEALKETNLNAEIQKYVSLINERSKVESKIRESEQMSAKLTGDALVANQKIHDILMAQKSRLDEQIDQEEKINGVKDSQAANEARETLELEKQFKIRNAETKKSEKLTLKDVLQRDFDRVGWRIANFGVISRLISKLPQSLQKIKQDTVQLEEALMNLRVVTGYNRKEGEALLMTYNKLSKQLGATTVEVANAADTWLRQGYDVDQAESLITASMKLSKLGKIDSAQATKSLKKDSPCSNAWKNIHLDMLGRPLELIPLTDSARSSLK